MADGARRRSTIRSPSLLRPPDSRVTSRPSNPIVLPSPDFAGRYRVHRFFPPLAAATMATASEARPRFNRQPARFQRVTWNACEPSFDRDVSLTRIFVRSILGSRPGRGRRILAVAKRTSSLPQYAGRTPTAVTSQRRPMSLEGRSVPSPLQIAVPAGSRLWRTYP